MQINSSRKRHLLGLLCIIGYGIITPLSSNVRQYYAGVMPMDVMIALSSCVTIIICYSFQVKNVNKHFSNIKIWLPTFLLYTTLDSLAWLGFFLIPAYWGAYFANYTYFVCQLLLGTMFLTKCSIRIRVRYLILLTLIASQLIYFYIFYSFINLNALILSILFVSIASITTFRAKFCLVKLVKLGLSETFIMANKWWALLIFSIVLSIVNQHNLIAVHYLVPGIIIGLSVMILPIFLYMKAVVYMSPGINAVVSGIVPLMTFFMQTYIFHKNLGTTYQHGITMAVLLAFTAVVTYFIFSKQTNVT